MTQQATWSEQPLRPGEYDVPVMFRVTAGSASDARATVERIVERDQFERTIVPMYVPPSTEEPTAAATAPAVHVGDFFECSWGYDQTNIDFYKVVSLSPSGKTAQVQMWSSASAGGDRVRPGDRPATTAKWVDGQYAGQQDAPVQTKRLRAWGDRPTFTVNDYSAAYLWDGQAAYQTPIGAGH